MKPYTQEKKFKILRWIKWHPSLFPNFIWRRAVDWIDNFHEAKK